MNLPKIYKLVKVNEFRLDQKDRPTFRSITKHSLAVSYTLDEWTKTKNLEFSLAGFNNVRTLAYFVSVLYGIYERDTPSTLSVDQGFAILECLTDSIVYYSECLWIHEIDSIVESPEQRKVLMEYSRGGHLNDSLAGWPLGTVFCTRVLPINYYYKMEVT